jgi:hypothetical protein
VYIDTPPLAKIRAGRLPSPSEPPTTPRRLSSSDVQAGSTPIYLDLVGSFMDTLLARVRGFAECLCALLGRIESVH